MAEMADNQRGKHVASAAEDAVNGGHVDFEQARREVGTSGGADDGDGGRRGRKTNRGNDDVGNAVNIVKHGYGGRKGGERGDFGVGEESVAERVRYEC